MKKSLPTAKTRFWPTVIAICLLVQGCCQTEEFTPSQICGRWTRYHDGISETIVFTPDHRYQQTVKTSDGRKWETTNDWKIQTDYESGDSGKLILITNLLKTYDAEKHTPLNPPAGLTMYGTNIALMVMEGGKLSLGEMDPYYFSKTSK